ncbi:hypothetical protein HAX54_011195, partial [Datura stramonium]|nr:hypothetical protein [Datura stramonium]
MKMSGEMALVRRGAEKILQTLNQQKQKQIDIFETPLAKGHRVNSQLQNRRSRVSVCACVRDRNKDTYNRLNVVGFQLIQIPDGLEMVRVLHLQ